jgi:hypothetical protein
MIKFRHMIRILKKTAICFVLICFLVPSASWAAYRIYLKNGSVISDIKSYIKAGGDVRFLLNGGAVGIPEGEVLKIEEYESVEKKAEETQKEPGGEWPPTPSVSGPPVPESPPAPAQIISPADRSRAEGLKMKIKEIEDRLDAISRKEQEGRKLNDEYRTVKLRIENIFGIGRSKAIEAINAGTETEKNPDKVYQKYLTPEQRSLLQANFIQKRELEDKLENMKTELEDLGRDKERLLEDKKEAEDELRRLSY